MGSVHDSQLVDVHPGELINQIRWLKQINEERVRDEFDWITCPLEFDLSIGTSWGGKVEFDMLDSGVDFVTMRGKGMKTDWNNFKKSAKKAYNVDIKINDEIEVDPDKYGPDIVVRDAVKYDAEVTISLK